MRILKSASVQEVSKRLYPQMIKVHEWLAQPDKLPLERLSYDRLEPFGIYWIDTHDHVYLWLGKEASPDLLKRIVGTTDIANLNQMNGLAEIEGSVKKNPLWTLYNNVGSLSRFHLIRQGLDMEIELSSVMVEDEICFQMSYPDYLCEMHKQIKLEVNKEREL
ncbi:hypothetical protein G6F56_013335 [Rhizopus delemar]|nr:hypothetical protein G6F56_013335 [Rhizopus delemar]